MVRGPPTGVIQGRRRRKEVASSVTGIIHAKWIPECLLCAVWGWCGCVCVWGGAWPALPPLLPHSEAHSTQSLGGPHYVPIVHSS